MITCNHCGVELTDDNWFPSWKKSGKKKCKACHTLYHKELRNRSERYRKYEAMYRKNNREKIAKQSKIQTRKRKIRAFNLISNNNIKCVRCGCDDIKLLEINHIKGGGTKEYKLGINSAVLINNILNGSRGVDDLELLCRPCNSIHYLELKYPKIKGMLKVVWNNTPKNIFSYYNDTPLETIKASVA